MESPGSTSESECEVRSRSQRVRQLLARFQVDSSSESESSDSGILCGLCGAREPPNLNVVVVFWVDCGNHDDWFHTACGLGDIIATHATAKYVCMNCVV